MTTSRPAAWAVLEQALLQRRPVAVRYQGRDRVLCPHVLGYKNGRRRVLAYQAGGATSQGRLPDNPRQRWRSLLVDEIEDPRLVDGPWESADNYSTSTNGIDEVAIAINRNDRSTADAKPCWGKIPASNSKLWVLWLAPYSAPP